MEPDTLRPAPADIRPGVTAPAHACTCACVHLRAGCLAWVPAPGSRHTVCSPWSCVRGSSTRSETPPDGADAQCTRDSAVVLATVTVVMVGVGVFAVC